MVFQVYKSHLQIISHLIFFPIEITAYLGENCVPREKDHNAIGKTSSQANFEVSFV